MHNEFESWFQVSHRFILTSQWRHRDQNRSNRYFKINSGPGIKKSNQSSQFTSKFKSLPKEWSGRFAEWSADEQDIQPIKFKKSFNYDGRSDSWFGHCRFYCCPTACSSKSSKMTYFHKNLWRVWWCHTLNFFKMAILHISIFIIENFISTNNYFFSLFRHGVFEDSPGLDNGRIVQTRGSRTMWLRSKWCFWKKNKRILNSWRRYEERKETIFRTGSMDRLVHF